MQFVSFLVFLFVGYSTVKVKDRGYVETVPQLVVKGIGYEMFWCLFK